MRSKLGLVQSVVRVPTLLTFGAGRATAQILLRGMQVELHGSLHIQSRLESECRPKVRWWCALVSGMKSGRKVYCHDEVPHEAAMAADTRLERLAPA